jgi:hypothetical protein
MIPKKRGRSAFLAGREPQLKSAASQAGPAHSLPAHDKVSQDTGQFHEMPLTSFFVGGYGETCFRQ